MVRYTNLNYHMLHSLYLQLAILLGWKSEGQVPQLGQECLGV